jgi:hypothetical protein
MCKGKIFEGYAKMYPTYRGYEIKAGLKLRKQESCPGCEECKDVLPFFHDEVTIGAVEWPIIQRGRRYRAWIENIADKGGRRDVVRIRAI